MAAKEEEDSLEFFLNKATDPSKVDQDQHVVMSFCDRVNNELEGPQVALRLLAHKIQSPQEREALHALAVVEACVQNCGGRFHQELGKFRFLNEMIKVVSPKYLGAYSGEKVTSKCIELMYSWSLGLPHEPKIKEAYSMLRKQGIVKTDPVLPDMPALEVPPPRQDTIFEDEEKSKLLARLLKSKNPDDLQAANRLIKNMVRQDIEKTEKKSKRMQELDTVNNNIKLLSEMLHHYSQNSSESDKEILKELYDSLEKRRPNLFRLASDTNEKENEAMMEILKTNDAVVKIMQEYQRIVGGKTEENGLLLDTGTPSHTQGRRQARSDMDELGDIFGTTSSSSTDILQLGSPTHSSQASRSRVLLSTVPPPPYTTTPPAASSAAQQRSLVDDISILDSSITTVTSHTSARSQATATSIYSELNDVFSCANDSSCILSGLTPEPTKLQPSSCATSAAAADSTATTAAAGGKKNGLSTLDDISHGLMKQSLGDKVSSKPFTPSSQPVAKMSLKEMQSQQQKQPHAASLPSPALHAMTSVTSSAASSITSAAASGVVQPLTDVFVKLETIQPGAQAPLTAYDKQGLKIVLHFGRDRPRPDVKVMVVSVMSTRAQPVANFQFQAAVPKVIIDKRSREEIRLNVMKVKLQPASATDLPAFNPILPSAAITQVMLVANPQNEKIRIKFKITFAVDGKTETDIGDVDIPQDSLL